MKQHFRLAALAGAIAAALCTAGPASAATGVVNGGFETGDFSGWTQFGSSAFDVVTCASPSPYVHAGDCAATFAASGATSGIEQSITGLTVGGAYVVSFAFLADGGTPGSFKAEFGGTTLVSLTNPAGGPYFSYAFQVNAASASQVLRFTFRDDPGFMFLDAVSVTAVPEPGGFVLAAAGLVLLGGRLRARAGR